MIGYGFQRQRLTLTEDRPALLPYGVDERADAGPSDLYMTVPSPDFLLVAGAFGNR